MAAARLPGLTSNQAQYSMHWPTARVGRLPAAATRSTSPNRRRVGCSGSSSVMGTSSNECVSGRVSGVTFAGRAASSCHQGAGWVSMRPVAVKSSSTARFAGRSRSWGAKARLPSTAWVPSRFTIEAGKGGGAAATATRLTPTAPRASASAAAVSPTASTDSGRTTTTSLQASAASGSALSSDRVRPRMAIRRSLHSRVRR